MTRPEWLLVLGLAPMILGPLILGPLPTGGGDSITAQLCGGGVIQIPIDGEPEQAPDRPCSKACHAGACRKRSAKGDTLELE